MTSNRQFTMSRSSLLIASMQLLQLLLLGSSVQLGLAGKWPPEVFPGKHQFSSGNESASDVETIPHLGRVYSLSTGLFHGTDVFQLRTKFSIHSRNGSSEVIAFAPDAFKYPAFSPPNEHYHYDLETMAKSSFDPKKRTVVMISGFMSNNKVSWLERVRDLWLELEDCNVIVVTWKDGNRYIYERAVATVPRVARQIGIFLHYLASLNGDSIENFDFKRRIHFIGHSLGSHIAGFVGQDLGGQMGRIVALDPAGPCFDQYPREHRLDPSDALLVEAIHTNVGKMRYMGFVKEGMKKVVNEMLLSPLLGSKAEMARSLSENFSGEGGTVWFGIDTQVGHIDYYANNGKLQPGCPKDLPICDHGRSHHIYEAMLVFERYLKQADIDEDEDANVDADRWRKENRLLAVNSVDYASFSSGEALNQRCPALLHERDRLAGSSEAEIRQCTVPMDQLTPVDELVGELRDHYQIEFDTQKSLSTQRYYFKTIAEEPLIGDHYLLQIRLERSSIWAPNCAFQAEIQYAEDVNTTVEIDRDLRLFANGDFFGLSLPFANPHSGLARLALDRMLRDYTRENQNQQKHELDLEASDLVDDILPTEVTLRLIQSSPVGHQSTFSKWFGGAGSQDPAAGSCNLLINSVEVHPLVGFKRSLFGLYKVKRRTSNVGGSIELVSHVEHKVRTSKQKPWFENLSNSQPNRELGLHALVIG